MAQENRKRKAQTGFPDQKSVTDNTMRIVKDTDIKNALAIRASMNGAKYYDATIIHIIALEFIIKDVNHIMVGWDKNELETRFAIIRSEYNVKSCKFYEIPYYWFIDHKDRSIYFAIDKVTKEKFIIEAYSVEAKENMLIGKIELYETYDGCL